MSYTNSNCGQESNDTMVFRFGYGSTTMGQNNGKWSSMWYDHLMDHSFIDFHLQKVKLSLYSSCMQIVVWCVAIQKPKIAFPACNLSGSFNTCDTKRFVSWPVLGSGYTGSLFSVLSEQIVFTMYSLQTGHIGSIFPFLLIIRNHDSQCFPCGSIEKGSHVVKRNGRLGVSNREYIENHGLWE